MASGLCTYMFPLNTHLWEFIDDLHVRYYTTCMQRFFPDHPDLFPNSCPPTKMTASRTEELEMQPEEHANTNNETHAHLMQSAPEEQGPVPEKAHTPEAKNPPLQLKALITHVQRLWSDKRFDSHVYDV